MPFRDNIGNIVGKGEEVTQTRTITASSGTESETVQFSDLISVNEAEANMVSDPTSDADGINHIDTSVGADNEVEITYSPTGGLNNEEDVRITVSGE